MLQVNYMYYICLCYHGNVSLVEAGLKFQYQSVWEHVLQVLGHFYRFLGNSYYSIMSQVSSGEEGDNCSCQIIVKGLVSLCELRNTRGFPCINQLDKTFAEAVESVGPR